MELARFVPGTVGFTWVMRVKKDLLCLAIEVGFYWLGGRKQGFCQLRLSNPKTTTIRFLSSADIPSSAQTQPYSPFVPTLQTEALAHGPSLQHPPQLPLRRQRGKGKLRHEAAGSGTQLGEPTLLIPASSGIPCHSPGPCHALTSATDWVPVHMLLPLPLENSH